MFPGKQYFPESKWPISIADMICNLAFVFLLCIIVVIITSMTNVNVQIIAALFAALLLCTIRNTKETYTIEPQGRESMGGGMECMGSAECMNHPPDPIARSLYTEYTIEPSSVDDHMARVMLATGRHSKDSLTNRTRYNARAFAKYYVDELDEQSQRHGWWDNPHY